MTKYEIKASGKFIKNLCETLPKKLNNMPLIHEVSIYEYNKSSTMVVSIYDWDFFDFLNVLNTLSEFEGTSYEYELYNISI